VLKPYIVFFGESLPDEFLGALDELSSEKTRLVFVMGTSLQVAPFKHLPEAAHKEAMRVLVNNTVRGFIYEDLEDFSRGFRADKGRQAQVKKALEVRRACLERAADLRELQGELPVEDVEDADKILPQCIPTPGPTAPLPAGGSSLEQLDLLSSAEIAKDQDLTARALLQSVPSDFFMGGSCDDSVRKLCEATGWAGELEEVKRSLDTQFDELCAGELLQQTDHGGEDLHFTLVAYRNSLVTPIAATLRFTSSDCNTTLAIVSGDAVFSGMLGIATDSQLSNLRAAGCLTGETCLVDLSQLPEEVRSGLMSRNPQYIKKQGPGQLEILVADKVIARPVYAPINGHWASYCHSFVGAVGQGIDVWDTATRLPGTTTDPELERQTIRSTQAEGEAEGWRDASMPPELQSAVELRPLDIDSAVFDSRKINLGLVQSSFLSRKLSGAPDSTDAGELSKTAVVGAKRFLVHLVPKYGDELESIRARLQKKAEAARSAFQDVTRLPPLSFSVEVVQGDGQPSKAGETPEDKLGHEPHVLVTIEYDASLLRDGREDEVRAHARAIFQRMVGDGVKTLSVEYQPSK